MSKFAALLGIVISAVLLVAAPVAAQVPSDYVPDLREFNVTFEEGAPGLSDAELNRLDNTTDDLQTSSAFYKVIVLAEPVTDYDTPAEFAAAVLQQLNGQGRVQVFDTTRVGIASNVPGDTEATLADAEDAAVADANQAESYAAGVAAAANVLGVLGGATVTTGASSGEAGGDDGGGSLAWLWIVLIIAAIVLGGLWVWSRLKKAKARDQASTVSLGEGEMKVRTHQDRAGNLVLELADRVDQPGAPAEARQLFQQGAAEFADLQDDLEQADTRPELEAVYPRIVDAVSKLESSKALLDGQPAPAAPAADPLFPAPPPPPAPAESGAPLGPVDVGGGGAGYQQYQPVPEPHYRSMGSSPWLTAAASAALTMLAGRMMAPQRSYRAPASDDIFIGGGGGGRGSGGRRSGGSSSGWSDLSGGSRRARGVRRRR